MFSAVDCEHAMLLMSINKTIFATDFLTLPHSNLRNSTCSSGESRPSLLVAKEEEEEVMPVVIPAVVVILVVANPVMANPVAMVVERGVTMEMPRHRIPAKVGRDR